LKKKIKHESVIKNKGKDKEGLILLLSPFNESLFVIKNASFDFLKKLELVHTLNLVPVLILFFQEPDQMT